MKDLIGKTQMKDYYYSLPDAAIAKYPLSERDKSKLLVFKNKQLNHKKFNQLDQELLPESLMVFNNTKVIQARLIFYKPSGARIEIFCLEPFSPREYELNFGSRGSCTWTCLVGNARKWKTGSLEQRIRINQKDIILKARQEPADRGGKITRFDWNDQSVSFSEILEAVGVIPIPPYLNRETEADDQKRYQTVYAKPAGSVAAPTAGLHFTDQVFQQLEQKGIQKTEITLHVGAGTFTPVKHDEIAEHIMHAEYIVVHKDSIKQIAASLEPGIVAVGTTSMRTLESLYWLGYLLIHQQIDLKNTFEIPQWLPYQDQSDCSTKESFDCILRCMEKERLEELSFKTRIIIIPGYRFHVVNQLITNFHQPGSTLLLLVSAFIGQAWKKVYQYALAHDFRFLSYGDSSILTPD